MTLRRTWILICAALMAAASLNAAAAQGRGGDHWEPLGCEEVGRRPDRDVIKVGRREGRYKAIRLAAAGNDVLVLDVKVVYANGQPDDIPVRAELREGTETRPLDLRGRERAIDRVELVTRRDFKGRGKVRARVCVFGLQDDRRAEGGKWEELGCQKVGFLIDRDVIKVGRREGRFKAIRLDVSGNAVYITQLKVVYANGVPDELPVRSEIRDGGQTRPLDLQGRERAIDRVELVYRAKPNFKGSARVCVMGRS